MQACLACPAVLVGHDDHDDQTHPACRGDLLGRSCRQDHVDHLGLGGQAVIVRKVLAAQADQEDQAVLSHPFLPCQANQAGREYRLREGPFDPACLEDP